MQKVSKNSVVTKRVFFMAFQHWRGTQCGTGLPGDAEGRESFCHLKCGPHETRGLTPCPLHVSRSLLRFLPSALEFPSQGFKSPDGRIAVCHTEVRGAHLGTAPERGCVADQPQQIRTRCGWL